MPDTSPPWLDKAADTIRQLADRPWTLFALLLALNAIARPCSITAHDARLYSLQALNAAEHGAYGADLFLAFGSQDRYSLFSRLVGPLVAALGLRLTFFLLYLVFNSLLVFALMRLVRVLIDDPLIATLSLVFLVTAPLEYGGRGIFMVHEQFLTPRNIATALTVLALERLLRGCYVTTFVLLLAGLAVHPLMAFPGVMIAVGFVACTWLPVRVFIGLAVLSCLALVSVLGVPALATRLFGFMDDHWHNVLRRTVAYNYLDTWTPKDWFNIALSFALPIVGCVALFRDDYAANATRRRFLAIAVLAGVVGVLSTAAASMLSYAFLFQAQPYRILWVLKAVQIPLAFLLIARWGRSASVWQQLVALAIFCYYCITHYLFLEFVFFGWMIPLSLGFGYFLERPERRDWWWIAVARAFVVGAVLWIGFRWWFFLGQFDELAQNFDLHEWILFDAIGPVVCLVALALGCAWLWQRMPYRAILCVAIVVAALVSFAFYATEVCPTFQRDYTRLGKDIDFVQQFVNERRADPAARPAIYSALARPDLLWIDVRATSYFDTIQTAGVLFHRATALEVERRIDLVKKFEMVRHRAQDAAGVVDDDKKVAIETQLNLRFNDDTTPTRADLLRLCDEPGLDYLVLYTDFPGLHSASNGRVFIYECNNVRRMAGERLQAPP